MLETKLAAFAALASTVSVIAAGAAHADVDAQSDNVIHYTASATGDGAQISTDIGSLAVENGAFEIKAPDGQVIAGTELSFRVDDFVFPIAAAIHDNSATLTPLFDLPHALYRPVDLPFQDTAPWKSPYDREQAAWNRMKDTISTGAVIGTTVGLIGGGVVGCALGGLAVGSGVTLATGIIGGLFTFLPGAVVGCLVGAAAMAPLGAIAGAIAVTAPVAIAAAIQYFTTINAPFNPAPAK
ncbi:hypothetical protein [Nocardia sp. NPDC020380]|uniref:hypothetical protein n=1 Tax=Nocardia sp. NPDC020380 TaxID=3364309 RepID=UPI0037A9053C